MAPKKKQATQNDNDGPIVGPSAADTEAPPLSFEDLPDQAIGLILRSCSDPLDRLRLTQASPSARRLCLAGPRQDPGCLGRLMINFPEREEGEEGTKPISLSSKTVGNDLGDHLCLTITPWHPECKVPMLAMVRDWIKPRVRAFTDIDFTFDNMWLDWESACGVEDLTLCTSAISVLLPSLHLLKGGLSLSVPLLDKETVTVWMHVLSSISFICPYASSRRLYIKHLQTDENNSTVSGALQTIFPEQQGYFTDLYVEYCKGPFPALTCTLSSLVLIGFWDIHNLSDISRAVPSISNLLAFSWNFHHPFAAPGLARSLSGSLQSLRNLCLTYTLPSDPLPPGTCIVPLSPLSALENLHYLALLLSDLRISGPSPSSASLNLAFDAPLNLKGLRELSVELVISSISPMVLAASSSVALPFFELIECPLLEGFTLSISRPLGIIVENPKLPSVSFSLGAITRFNSVHRLDFSLRYSLLRSLAARFSLTGIDLSESFPHLEYFGLRGAAPPSLTLFGSNIVAMRLTGFDEHPHQEYMHSLEAIFRPKVPRLDKVWLPVPLPRSFEELYTYAQKRPRSVVEGVFSFHPHYSIYFPMD